LDLARLAVVLPLHFPAGTMRAVAILTILVGAATYGVIHYAPHGEAQAKTATVPARQIQSIAIDPVTPLDSRGLPTVALHGVLESKPGELIDDAKLARDRDALEAELAARGFLSAKVSPATITFVPNAGASIVFDIDRGPMYHLRSVVVSGPGQRETSVVTLSAGDEAVRERLERARQILADSLARRGGKTTVVLALRNDQDAAAVDVELVTH
jgi:hypothetical protein